MNSLCESFPKCVVVEDEEYEIATDFRDWIRFIELVKDKEVADSDKAFLCMQWYKEDYPSDLDKALRALSDFLIMKISDGSWTRHRSPKQQKRPVFSYRYDAPYIYSAFLECYNIDLSDVDYMHWWKFQFLFWGLNEKTEIMKRISYRSVDLNTVGDKKERARIRKIQRKIAIPQEVMDDYDIANAFV